MCNSKLITFNTCKVSKSGDFAGGILPHLDQITEITDKKKLRIQTLSTP